MDLNTFPDITRLNLSTLQVNIGYKCNQTCAHCHVNAGPSRIEMMDSETISLILDALKIYKIKTLDITGGAPEMHPEFMSLVKKAREMDVEVIDRCNLTILNEPGYEELPRFLSDNHVVIIASLPCYEKENVDMQRGKGVFESSIKGLQKLNSMGYGDNNKNLTLNLVYNPQGPNLPPPQKTLESDYKDILYRKYGIKFNSLLTITNMPINRFALQLNASHQLDQYLLLLKSSHNKSNLESVMCRSLISVDWQGYLYDCDFNQQLGISCKSQVKHISELISEKYDFLGKAIAVDHHCFGCTAGSGSSCSGALESK